MIRQGAAAAEKSMVAMIADECRGIGTVPLLALVCACRASARRPVPGRRPESPPSNGEHSMPQVRCVLPARSLLSEGALWSPREQALYWLDQMRPELHRFDPARGTDTRFDLPLPVQLGALVPRQAGGFVLAAADGLSFIDAEFKRRTPFAQPVKNQPRACFNDGKCDRQGRLWAGTTDRQESDPIGALFRFERDGGATLIADGFIASNGPSFSPDGRIMYHTSSHDRTIYAYDIDRATGTASNRRIFVRIDPADGIPDGSTVDAEGHLWTTHWGGWRVTRFAPDGRVERVVEMPFKAATSCAFGGPDLTTLYVTSASIDFGPDGGFVQLTEAEFDADPTAGGIFAVEVGIRGLSEPAFRG
jgi:sugar lactone lactonase YvrE